MAPLLGDIHPHCRNDNHDFPGLWLIQHKRCCSRSVNLYSFVRTRGCHRLTLLTCCQVPWLQDAEQWPTPNTASLQLLRCGYVPAYISPPSLPSLLREAPSCIPRGNHLISELSQTALLGLVWRALQVQRSMDRAEVELVAYDLSIYRVRVSKAALCALTDDTITSSISQVRSYPQLE